MTRRDGPSQSALWAVGLVGVCLLAGCERAGDAAPTPAATLVFSGPGQGDESRTLEAMRAQVGVRTVAGRDPYYGDDRRYAALPMRPLLENVFGAALAERDGDSVDVRLVAADGYAVSVPWPRLRDEGAAIAFDDLDRDGWSPIGPQRADPGPFYLVWQSTAAAPRQDLGRYPRPWQLARVELADFAATHPHVLPAADAPSVVRAGFSLFRDRCVRCHAINREGGRVGPELNVPQNITEYRPEAQIRAYIRNPAVFRYGNMPAHEDLSDEDLDALLAYLRHKAHDKHDPDRGKAAHGG